VKTTNSNHTVERPELTTLPIWGLDNRLQDYIMNIAETYQCPRDFVTAAVFSVASTAAGNKVTVKDKFKSSLCLWQVLLCPSGGGKTEPIKAVMAPLTELNIEYANKSFDDKPIRVIIDNVSETAVINALDRNRDGLLLCRDEIHSLFMTKGIIDNLLSIYSHSPILKDRANCSITIERPYMSILGGIQPERIQECFGHGNWSNGLGPRFLFCWTDDEEYPSYSMRRADPLLANTWGEFVYFIYNLPSSTTVEIDPDAMLAYTRYYNELAMLRNSKNTTIAENVLYGKLQINILRLAGVVAVLRYVSQPSLGLKIDMDCIYYAIRCMDYYQACGKRVILNLNQKQENRGLMLDKIPTADLIRELNKRRPISNQSAFAKGLGVKQPYISKIINN
jgi:hypothetical protein